MPIPMTIEGAESLREELQHRKGALRQEITQAIAEAREHGDLKENAEYHAAKEKQGQIEARIAHLEGVISRADVIDPSQLDGDRVKFVMRLRGREAAYIDRWCQMLSEELATLEDAGNISLQPQREGRAVVAQLDPK